MQSETVYPQLEQKLSFKPFIRAGWAAILLLILSFGIWSLTSKIQGAVISAGQVEVQAGRHVVQHKYGGDVEEIFVEESDIVSKGDVLIRLDDSEIRSQLASARLQYYESVAQSDRLEAEAGSKTEIEFDESLQAIAADNPNVQAMIENQRSIFKARQENTDTQRKLFKERVAQNDELINNSMKQIESMNEQKKVNDEEVARVTALRNRRLATTAAITNAQNVQSQIQNSLITAQANLANFQSQKEQAIQESAAFETERQEAIYRELRENEAQRNVYEEETRRLEDQLNSLEILSPRDGYVYEMQVNSLQAVIRPAEPIMYIIPNNAEYIVKTTVSPSDIDEVYLGQQAEVQFSGLSAQLLPKLRGEVTSISADAIQDEYSRLSYFEVETSVNQGELEKLGDIKLHPGMAAEVFLVTQEQTPFAYLTTPARRYFDRALR